MQGAHEAQYQKTKQSNQKKWMEDLQTILEEDIQMATDSSMWNQDYALDSS